MALDGKPLESLVEADLQDLIDNQVPESKAIDYKEFLPSNSDSGKRGFLEDVSSFANASAGHIVFGMQEINGVASNLVGLHSIDPDAAILRLENMVRDGMEPRIPGITMRNLPLKNANSAIVIHIPKSWAIPHRVIFAGHGHFYSRNSAGKYRLDVSELRTAFSLSNTTAERIRNFRAERLSLIVSGEAPAPLDEAAKTILHIVPLSAFDQSTSFDVASLDRDIGRLNPIYSNGWDYRHNFDGILTYTGNFNSASERSYLQVFRNGSIEAVDTRLLHEYEGQRTIPSRLYERELLDSIPRFLSIQNQLGVVPPIFLMLTLMGVSGYIMAVNHSRVLPSRESHPIDRDTLVLPEVMTESFNQDIASLMQPIFDAVWNAAGWPRSINYDAEGAWVGH